MSIPKSLLLLPIAVVAFLVQLIPYVGVITAMALAPFWPVILVNGAMVGTAIETWLRDEDGPSRLWLLLPVLWFGGYLGLFVSDQIALSGLRSDFEAANQGAPLAFDPARHALVFGGTSGGASIDPSQLVRSGQLPVVYERVQSGERNPPRMFAYRLIPSEECGRNRRERNAVEGAGIRVMRYGDSCVLRVPEQPAGAIVELTGRETRGVERGMAVERRTLQLRMPDGTTRRLVTGITRPLPLLPMPVAGCFFECEIGFYRPKLVYLGEPEGGTAALVAQALGLGPTRQGAAMSTEQARTRLAEASAGAMRHDFDDLEKLLANPAARIDVVPFTVLRRYPERLAPYVGRMIAALERAVALGDPVRDNGRNLARLVALLPPENFRSVGGRVLALYQSAPEQHWLHEADDLLSRTGDLGDTAVPVLLAQLERLRGYRRQAAVIGLCRIGRPAAAQAGPRLLALWRADSGGHSNRGGRSSDVDQALYAALLRLGLRDAVGPVTQDWKGAWYAAAWRDINPAAPPERCNPNMRVGR